MQTIFSGKQDVSKDKWTELLLAPHHLLTTNRWSYHVEVTESDGSSQTRHKVSMDKEYY